MNQLSLLFSIMLSCIVVDTNQGSGTIARQRVDLIELNHFVDDQGREVFRQVIFYDWSNQHQRFHVRAWRLIKNDSQLPMRRWNPQQFQCNWDDNGILRQVWAPKMRETWSQRDPERINRAMLPENQRIPLFQPSLPNEGQAPQQRIAEQDQPAVR